MFVLWATANTAIATVSQTGLVTAVAAGTVLVGALSGGIGGTATITVTGISTGPDDYASRIGAGIGDRADRGDAAVLGERRVEQRCDDGAGRDVLCDGRDDQYRRLHGGQRRGPTGSSRRSRRRAGGYIGGHHHRSGNDATQVVLTPATVTLGAGGTQPFAVSGVWSNGATTAPAVTYSATGGTITSAGLYTAGSTAGTFRVIAVQQGGTLADTSAVTITVAALTPHTGNADAAIGEHARGGTQQFAVSGVWSNGATTAPAVNYSATGGTISASGLYTAGSTAGAFRVIAVQQGVVHADTSSSVTITAAASSATTLLSKDSRAAASRATAGALRCLDGFRGERCATGEHGDALASVALDGGTGCAAGHVAVRLYAEQLGVLSYWIKMSSNWVGSRRIIRTCSASSRPRMITGSVPRSRT